MDSTELQREALEEKGRDELTTIATALGGKPGSRARKAEIVDLILDLAGDNGAAVASSNGAPDRSDEPLAEWELAVAEDGDSDETAETTDHDSGRADPKPTDDAGEPTGPGPVGGDRQASERSHSGQQFSESGNRRRRRRGRGPVGAAPWSIPSSKGRARLTPKPCRQVRRLIFQDCPDIKCPSVCWLLPGCSPESRQVFNRYFDRNGSLATIDSIS